jgi:exonuclease III
MNPQNGQAAAATMLPSPLPNRQLFSLSAGAPPVEPRTDATRATETNRQSGSAIDNDCTTITISTYNIRDGRNSNLEAALRACEQMRIDVGILTETKLSTDRYTRSAYGYTVFATTTTHFNQGGIALIFTNKSLYFQIEAQRKHGPNVISCIITTGLRQYPVIGAYIPPGDTTTLAFISEASNRFPGQPILLMGDINVDLRTNAPSTRDTEIMAFLATLGLEDMAMHFTQRKNFRHGNTWSMEREGTLLQSRCDYILGTDRRLFQYILIKDPRYHSDHLMVTGGLRSAPKRENVRYLRSRRKFPLRRQQTTTHNATEREYDKIKQCIDIQAPEVERQARAPWISSKTWQMIDSRASKAKSDSFHPGERQRLSRRIKRALQKDRKQRTAIAGNEIEQNLQSGKLKAAWDILQRWYKHTGDRPPRPTRLDLHQITNEYKILYRATQPHGEPIPIHIEPCAISDAIPDENEIADAVRRLKNGKAPGHSGMRAEHLKALLHRAVKENATEDDCLGWKQICKTVQQIFETGDIPQEMTWSILVLIPKTSGGARGIGLLETMWKICSSIINKRLQEGIPFHESLHGFRPGLGTGTASLQAKLQIQLAHIRSVPIYQIFLDLSKAYDTLDRTRTLQILQDYGTGTKILRLITKFWDSLTIVAKQSGYHGEPFRSERGTTQGDIVSPTIFNVVVDAVVRAWYHKLDSEGLTNTVKAIFYADDGYIYSTNADALQQATDWIVDLFECMGLKANPEKTKAMICAPRPSVTRICTPAYKRKMGDNAEPTYSERKRQYMVCDFCNEQIQARSLSRHKRSKHGIDTTAITAQTTPPHLSEHGSTYEVSMPEYKQQGQCPVPGCAAIIKDRHGMRRHFLFRHYYDTIIILEEGRLPRCDDCGMFCTLSALAGKHMESALCREGARRNRRKIINLRCIRAFRRTFQLRDQPIETVTAFRYLGRVITSRDNDWEAARRNLHKAKERWASISRILMRESATPRISALFYKATIMTILLFGSETWVINNEILQLLTTFHHSIARRLTGRHPRPVPETDEEWIHPSIQETLRIAGLFTVDDYLRRRRNYLESYAQHQYILTECQQALQCETPTKRIFWWNQPLSSDGLSGPRLSTDNTE